MPKDSSPRSEAQSQQEISLVFAYYDNPQMLALQWNKISQYESRVQDRIEVIIVDDASPHSAAAEVMRPAPLPHVSIYRVAKDIRWNQDAARNIGAHEARSRWLLLTDIDHVVPAETLSALINMEKDPSVFYTFGRIKLDGGGVREPHPNSYFMSKELYWSIGGHDEDFAGIYGKDFLFRKRALKKSREVALPSLPLARVGSTLILDAGTTGIFRANFLSARVWGYLLVWLKAAKLWRGIQTLQHAYRKVV